MTTVAPPHRGAAVERSSSRVRALTAARTSLLEIGPTRTTMVEVARRSGVGRTTLYRHWKDSSALFADLLTRELATVVERLSSGPWDARPHDAGSGAGHDAGHDAGRGARHGAGVRDANDIARLVCDLADALRTDPLLGALRRHEPELLAIYLLDRLGTAQRHLSGLLRDGLTVVIATDHRLSGRDPDRTAHMLFLAVQGAVLSAPLADPPLDPDGWRAELDRLVKGYLGL